jgi:DNA-binding NarL/FixJ family response regulator
MNSNYTGFSNPIQDIINIMKIPVVALEIKNKRVVAVNQLLIELIGSDETKVNQIDILSYILNSCLDEITLDNIIDLILSEGITSYSINSMMRNNQYQNSEMIKVIFSLQSFSGKDILIISFKKINDKAEYDPVVPNIVNTTSNLIEENRYDISSMYKGISNFNRSISVLIADDNPMTAKLIEKNISQVSRLNVEGIVKNGREAIDFLNYKTVDVIILDVNMPIMNGMETLTFLKEQNRYIKIVMLSGDCTINDLQESFTLGANGFISKQSNNFDIINSIFTVFFGGYFLCSICIKNILGSNKHLLQNSSVDKQLSSFIKAQNTENNTNGFDISLLEEKAQISKREKEIIKLVALGKSNIDIADKLFISVRTVETHRRNILQKFGEKNFFNLFLCNNK